MGWLSVLTSTFAATTRVEIEAHPMFKRIRMIQGSSIDEAIAGQALEIARSKKRVLVALDSIPYARTCTEGIGVIFETRHQGELSGRLRHRNRRYACPLLHKQAVGQGQQS